MPKKRLYMHLWNMEAQQAYFNSYKELNIFKYQPSIFSYQLSFFTYQLIIFTY